MRECPKCKLQIENDSARFCKKCGTKLPEIKPQEVERPAQEVATSNVEEAPTATNEIIAKVVTPTVSDNTSNILEIQDRGEDLSNVADGIMLGEFTTAESNNDNESIATHHAEATEATEREPSAKLASNEVATNAKRVKPARHGFISFVLWVATIVSTFVMLYSIAIITDPSCFGVDEEIASIQLAMNILAVVGFILLLQHSRRGFNILLCVSIVYAMLIMYLSYDMIGIALVSILLAIPPILGIGALYGVLHIKKDGRSYWEAISRSSK